MTDDQLISIVQIFRHGERIPIKIYPTNPRQLDFYLPILPGELTNRGKTQTYELGKFTRNRYKDFLPDIFSKNDVRIYTTAHERSNVSAQLFGAGLYPPTEKEIWNDELKWNPIPIFTCEPHILNYTPKPVCPLYRKLYKDALKELLKKFKQDPMADLILKNVGQEIDEYIELNFIYDTWRIERYMGLDQPEWVNRAFPVLARYYESFYGAIVQNEQMRRLCLGPIFNEIVQHFEKMSTDSASGRKLIAYCGHDTNIALMLDTLQAFVPHFPGYAYSLFFELHKKNGEYFVKLFYKKEEIEAVQIARKYFDISLKEFKGLLSNVLIDKDSYFNECFVGVGLYDDGDNSPY